MYLVYHFISISFLNGQYSVNKCMNMKLCKNTHLTVAHKSYAFYIFYALMWLMKLPLSITNYRCVYFAIDNAVADDDDYYYRLIEVCADDKRVHKMKIKRSA